MASRSGRRGEFSPEPEAIPSHSNANAPIDATMDIVENSTAGGMASPQATAAAPPASGATAKGAGGAANAQGDAVEGCRTCGKDDDHANLLLCEACNDEYHTYCLNPPLQSVPEGDFFCVKCKHLHSAKDDDGLDSLVSALPPSYTSRFGEIVWAAGGVGFGWWPACIYDPRLTVGGARQLARKNLGRKHLVYFFECNDAPFTVLSEHKLTKWDDGFLEEYDLGKIAKSSKSRSVSFEKALHVAMLENGRPMELRMDWNHQGNLVAIQPKVPKSGAGGGRQNANSPVNENHHPNKKPKPSPPASTNKGISRVASSSSFNKSGHLSCGTDRQSISVNRKNMTSAVLSLSSHDGANAIEPLEDGSLVCKILRRISLGTGVRDQNHTSEGLEFSKNVGFITLPSRQSATFECIRKSIDSDLDDDCFPMKDGKRRGWKFYVPKLGPVSIKQEGKIGPVLEFLKSTTNDVQLGNGTASNPLKVVIMDW